MRVIIAAAGTGGHINPGIAIANKIKSMEKDSEIIFVGTSRGLEVDLVPRAGYGLKTLKAYGIARKLTLENIRNLYCTIKSIKEAKKLMQEFKPDVVIGTGGYICMPVIIAANKMKIPTLLHESNAFPGVSVKLLSKRVNTVLLGFEDAKERLPKAKRVVVTGNPTKIKKQTFSNAQKSQLIQQMGLSQGKPIVLVFGGSQGAESINKSFIHIIEKQKNKEYQIMWAAGPAQYEVIKKQLQEKQINIEQIENVKIVPYIYNMEEVIGVVDMVVCRSGAMTITEIAIAEKPAIFIPFPYATENHQEYNARVLEKLGAAKIILDKDLNETILHDTITKMILDKSKLEKMSQNAKKASKDNVEENIYQEVKKAIKQRV